MVDAKVTQGIGNNITAFCAGLSLGFGRGRAGSMLCKAFLFGTALVLAIVPVAGCVAAPLVRVVVTEGVAVGGAAAVPFAGLGLGAGGRSPVVAESIFNYTVMVGNFNACGCVFIEFAAGALVVCLVAVFGAGCFFSLNRCQVVDAKVAESVGNLITAFGADNGIFLRCLIAVFNVQNKGAVVGAAVGFTGMSVAVFVLIAPCSQIPIVWTVVAVRPVAIVANRFNLTGGGAAVTIFGLGMGCVNFAGAAVCVVAV